MLVEGQRLGDFEILDHIGQGGMGVVFKARQTSLERVVALKTLKPFVSDDPDYVARFHREAVAAAALNHPNLVQVYAAGEAEGIHYFAMEFIDGESAQGRLERRETEERDGRIEPLEAIAIATHISVALEHGWRKAGLIHRDIKPDNIFLSTEGEVKLGDLGLAKSGGESMATQTGAAIGSAHYISPEQAEGKKDIDLRADIYSLGCTLYHLLAGRTPYAAESALATMLKHVSAPVPDLRGVWPECPGELAALVRKMMQKAPDDRFQSHGEVTTELRRVYDFLCGNSVPNAVGVTPDSAVRRSGIQPGVPVKKSRMPLFAGIMAGVLALAATVFFVFKPQAESSRSASPKPPDAPARSIQSGAAAALPAVGSTPAAAPKNATLVANAVKDTPSAPTVAASAENGINDPGHPAPQKPAATTATTVAAATNDVPFANTLQMRFVPIPGTKVLFSIWDTRVQDYEAYAAANPQADGSWKTMNKEGVPEGREPDHPVVGVSWEDARAFCQWLTEKEQAEGKLPKGMKYRLPSDEEWSRAVGLPPEPGSTPAEKGVKSGEDFPWGKDWPPTGKVGNYADETFHAKFPAEMSEKENKSWIEGYDDGYTTTSPVGSFTANAFGLYDMEGNVHQWCEDWFDVSHQDRVLRGASWDSHDRSSLQSSHRDHHLPEVRSGDVGFRCVLETEPAIAATPKPASETEKWFAQVDGPKQDVYRTQAVQPFEAGLEELRTHYLATLDAAIAKTSAASQLSEAVAFRAERQAFAESQNVTANDTGVPAGVLAMRVAFRQQLLKLDQTRVAKAKVLFAAYDAILEKNQALLTQHQRFDEALILKTKRDEIAGAWLAPSPLLPAAAATSPEVAKATPAPMVTKETVAALANASKEKPFVNTLGMKFAPVLISRGTDVSERVLFSIWDTRVQDYATYAKANKVNDSWMRQEYKGLAVSQSPEYPVVGVDWDEAQAFCKWLTQKESMEGKLPAGMKYRLPTDEEWSRAVGLPPEQGSTPQEKDKLGSLVEYPWGRGFPPKSKVGNYPDTALRNQDPKADIFEGYTDGYVTTSPVGIFHANKLGLYDMGGNVWQWCEDWFDTSQGGRTVRGSSWWNYLPITVRSACRKSFAPTLHYHQIGFRCVLSASEH